jgi:predicted RNase H-like nuclease (RuvC/YqgF family)
MSEEQKGLRARLDEETDRRRQQAGDVREIAERLEKIRGETERLGGQIERLKGELETLKTLGSDGVKELDAIGHQIAEYRTTAQRVARTMQERRDDLLTIKSAGEAAARMKKEVRGLKWWTRLEGIGMMLGAILIAALLLWTTTTLSLYVLPQSFRLSSAEIEKVEDAEALYRATEAMTEEERAEYRQLMQAGMSRADSLEAARK